MDNKVTITGTIEDVRFHNEDNGWSVLVIEHKHEPLVVVGTMTGPAEGAMVQVTGVMTTHPKYGEQLKAERITTILPTDAIGIERFLGSGLVKGIGPVLASIIVDTFGADTLQILDEQPDRLLDVPGIGDRKLEQIVESWREQQNAREVVDFLATVNVTPNLAVKICRVYGGAALEIVKTDPYRLAMDVDGVGFKTADRIAQGLQIARDHPSRLKAGMAYVLRELTNDGHVFSPRGLLLERSTALLGVDSGRMVMALDSAAARPDESGLVIEGDSVYLASLHHAETSAASNLLRLGHAKETRGGGWAASIFLELYREGLNDDQARALDIALNNPVSVLTGGPGTGKTHTMKALIETLNALHKKIALVAPTGRAAKRLSESSGHDAMTIHRLLKFVPGQEEDSDTNEDLQGLEFIVVDEASMLDITLAHRLFKALPTGCHVLLVGDIDQLPSVGPGNVLRDIIDSGVFPVTRLTEIFRQKATSGIVVNAHRINQGQEPLLDNRSADFFFFTSDTGADAANLAVDLVTERIPRKFNVTSDQIQLLVPMYRGGAGVNELNSRLQQVLNPPGFGKAERVLSGTLFREGDRVMQTVNNYDKSVYNGDIGRLDKIDLEEYKLYLTVDERTIEYEFEEAEQLVLAYAVSIHKSQGSEYPIVLIVLLNEHYRMLARNLLYTAVTRAKSACVLVSNRKAVNTAVANNRIARRYTALKDRLVSGHASWQEQPELQTPARESFASDDPDLDSIPF